MAVEIAYDPVKNIAVMFCNTSDTAFGPIFDSPDAAEDFIGWLREAAPLLAVGSHIIGDGTDPRDYPPCDLEEMVNEWKRVREDT